MPFRFSTFASICTHKFLIIPLKGKRVERLMGAHNIFYSSFILMHRFTTHHHRLLRSDDDTCYVHFYHSFDLLKVQICWAVKKSFRKCAEVNEKFLFIFIQSENYENVYGKLKQQLSVCVTFHSFSLLHFFISSRMHVYRVLFLAKLYVFCFTFFLCLLILFIYFFSLFFIIITIFFTYN